MFLCRILLFVTVLVFGNPNPILEGKNAGKIKENKDISNVLNSGQFPYVVHLSIVSIRPSTENPQKQIKVIGTCAGVLIKLDAILTAAHCFDKSSYIQNIWAWAGIVDITREKRKGQRIAVKYIKRHEKFIKDEINFRHDIAVLWLEREFKIDGKYIKLATLPERNSNLEYRHGIIVGWGLTTCGEMSSMLQKATIAVISQQTCQAFFNKNIISDRVICVLSNDKKSIIAPGDSGGPLIVHGTVVGISSFAAIVKNNDGTKLQTCDPEKPGVFTDVSKYSGWIKTQLKDGPPIEIEIVQLN